MNLPISTNILKCAKKAFEFFKVNIGFWLQLSIFSIQILILVKTLKKGISQISNYMHLVEPKNQSISSSPTPKLSSNHLVKDSFEGENEGNNSNTQQNNDKITIDEFLSPSSFKRKEEHYQSRRHVNIKTPMFYNYCEKEKPRQDILHPIDENLKHDDKHFRVPTKKLSQKSVVLLLLIK